jgi:hypothetical protein
MPLDKDLETKKNILEETINSSEIHFNKAYKINEYWNIKLTLLSVFLTLLATTFGTLDNSKIISDQTKNLLTALFAGSAVALQSLMGSDKFPVRERARANRKLRNRIRKLSSYNVKAIQNEEDFNEVKTAFEKILEDESSID